MSKIEFDTNHWDCHCNVNYIQPIETYQCTVCGRYQLNAPKSRLVEVAEAYGKGDL